MTHTHIIKNVLPGSIAEELEISAGDKLLAINDQEIEDVFDYHFLANEEYLTVLIEKPDGEQWELEIEKEYEEDLGIEFEQGLMDEYRSCRNKCIFCFIDQMPKDMRETLYFKDDDSRLSFLQGNYVTLTNMSDHDIDRIIRYHLEPINVSFQTTNPELRCKMLHNRFAGEALKKVDRLYEGGITMNGQIVLCKGINDGEELERSIRDLMKYAPQLQSVSVVPVGLSKYRDGLYPLQPFTKEDAKEVLHIIHKWQKKAYEELGEKCGILYYKTLSALLVQHLQKGSGDMGRILEEEAGKAQEIRRQQARILGEQASTKLLFPMILMLLVVFILLMVPAWLTFSI